MHSVRCLVFFIYAVKLKVEFLATLLAGAIADQVTIAGSEPLEFTNLFVTCYY